MGGRQRQDNVITVIWGGPTWPGSSCNFCFALLGEILMTLPCLVSPAWFFSSKAHEGQTWFIFFLPSFVRGNSSGVPPCPPGGYSSPLCFHPHPQLEDPYSTSYRQKAWGWKSGAAQSQVGGPRCSPAGEQLGGNSCLVGKWPCSPGGVQLLRPVDGRCEFWVLPANS